MKRINLILYLVYVLLNSCTPSQPIKIKQIESDEIVTIFKNVKNGPNKSDSISITVPIEFRLIVNESKVKGLLLYYFVDKKLLSDHLFDYQLYNKKNKREPIYSLEPYFKDNPLNIIIKERNHLISKDDANTLLKKYNIGQSVNSLKFGDTIKLVPFDQLIKENKKILDELNKVNDSLFFRITLKEGEVFIMKQKIKW